MVDGLPFPLLTTQAELALSTSVRLASNTDTVSNLQVLDLRSNLDDLSSDFVSTESGFFLGEGSPISRQDVGVGSADTAIVDGDCQTHGEDMTLVSHGRTGLSVVTGADEGLTIDIVLIPRLRLELDVFHASLSSLLIDTGPSTELGRSSNRRHCFICEGR